MIGIVIGVLLTTAVVFAGIFPGPGSGPGRVSYDAKAVSYYVWPVRGGQ